MAKILLNKKNASKLLKALETKIEKEDTACALTDIIFSLKYAEVHGYFSVDALIERLEASD